MKLLLDTHAFIWWDSEPHKLSSHALTLLENPQNQIILSIASVWEMQIKLQLGKLKLHLPLGSVIEHQQKTNHLTLLPVLLEHVLGLESLVTHHKDPFDRLLIAQAIAEESFLISSDPIFSMYSVKVLW